jgi:hypothetical protein
VLKKLNRKDGMVGGKSNAFHWIREWMLDTLEWQSINQRIKNGMVPGYLMDIVHFRHNEIYQLRNADDFKLPRMNKMVTQNCVFYSGLKLYNCKGWLCKYI